MGLLSAVVEVKVGSRAIFSVVLISVNSKYPFSEAFSVGWYLDACVANGNGSGRYVGIGSCFGTVLIGLYVVASP